MKLMRETCEKQGVTVLLNTRVTDAEVADGKFTAILAEGPEGLVKIHCRAVIMATGSWICNHKYLEMANPTFAAMGFGMPRPSGHTNCNYTGDGIPLAEKVGAFVDYDSFASGPWVRAWFPRLGTRSSPRGRWRMPCSAAPTPSSSMSMEDATMEPKGGNTMERYDGKTRKDDIKKWMLISIPIVLVVIGLLAGMHFLKKAKAPDYTVVKLCDPPLTEAATEDIRTAASVLGDLDGNGKVNVAVKELRPGPLGEFDESVAPVFLGDYVLFLISNPNRWGADILASKQI